MNVLRHSNTALTLPIRLPAIPFMGHLIYVQYTKKSSDLHCNGT